MFLKNNSVVKIMSIPESTVKDHDLMNYQVIRESMAAGMIKLAKWIL